MVAAWAWGRVRPLQQRSQQESRRAPQPQRPGRWWYPSLWYPSLHCQSPVTRQRLCRGTRQRPCRGTHQRQCRGTPQRQCPDTRPRQWPPPLPTLLNLTSPSRWLLSRWHSPCNTATTLLFQGSNQVRASQQRMAPPTHSPTLVCRDRLCEMVSIVSVTQATPSRLLNECVQLASLLMGGHFSQSFSGRPRSLCAMDPDN